jgi:hypothetical protein
LWGYICFLFFATGLVVISQSEARLRAAIVNQVRDQQARNPDPQARQMLEYFLTPHGFIVMLVFAGVIFVLLSGLGGAVSAALLKRKQPPE